MKTPSKISRIDVVHVLWPQISPFCGPLYFGTSNVETIDVERSATFTLVNTGTKKLLITNAHVLNAFEQEKRVQSHLKFWVCLHGGQQFILDVGRHCGYDRSLDLVAFDMDKSDEQLPIRFYQMNFPVRRLGLGDKILSVGYPGCFRTTFDTPQIEFGAVPMALNVTRVVDTISFMADISDATYENPKLENNPDERLGGISGSPCFFIRDALSKPDLVGFVKESCPLFGARHEIAFTHASRVKQDGSISDF